jgi:hypothetical protein
MSRELKSLVSRSSRGGRAEQGLDHSYGWNLDKGVLQHAELEDEDDVDGPDDCCDNDDEHAVENLGSHVVDLDQLFSFIETNFCCRMCASKGESSLAEMSHGTAGMATTITFSCCCDLLGKRKKKHTKSLEPEMRAGAHVMPQEPDSPSSCSINCKAVLAMLCSRLGFMAENPHAVC